MNIHAIMHRSYPAVMLLSLGLASPVALAQAPIWRGKIKDNLLLNSSILSRK